MASTEDDKERVDPRQQTLYPLDTVPILTFLGSRPQFTRSDPQPRSDLPPVIWTFWGTQEVPQIVKHCLSTWRLHLPNHGIRMVFADSIEQFCGTVPDKVSRLGVQKLSDWVRLELLFRHGGIWMDATTLLFGHLEFIYRHFARFAPDFFAFFNETRTTDPLHPMIENWFMAAPANSPFLLDLRREYAKAIDIGDDTYVGQAIKAMGKDCVLQGFPHLGYFSQHVALQITTRRPHSYALSLVSAERGPFLLPNLLNWNAMKISQTLLTTNILPSGNHIAKLTSKIWRKIEDDIHNGLTQPRSTIGQIM